MVQCARRKEENWPGSEDVCRGNRRLSLSMVNSRQARRYHGDAQMDMYMGETRRPILDVS